MKHIVWKAFYDYEKEEKYLNEMAARGWALTGYTWCRYVFEDAAPGEYIYRLEMLENPVNHPESQNYIQFMEETGAEFVTSYMRWVYLRKRASDGNFDIYSDIESKVRHYKRIRALFAVVMGINFMAGIGNLFSAAASHGVSVNFYISILSFAIALLFLVFLVMPLNRQISTLEREKEIRE